MFSKKESGEEEKKITIDDVVKMVNDLIQGFGVDPDQCRHKPKNSWTLYRGSARIYIEILKMNEVDCIEISSAVIQLPSRNLLAFYRKLLELNFNFHATKFYVRNDWVYLAENREIEGLDFAELKAMENRVSYFSDKYDDVLIEEFKTDTSS